MNFISPVHPGAYARRPVHRSPCRRWPRHAMAPAAMPAPGQASGCRSGLPPVFGPAREWPDTERDLRHIEFLLYPGFRQRLRARRFHRGNTAAALPPASASRRATAAEPSTPNQMNRVQPHKWRAPLPAARIQAVAWPTPGHARRLSLASRPRVWPPLSARAARGCGERRPCARTIARRGSRRLGGSVRPGG